MLFFIVNVFLFVLIEGQNAKSCAGKKYDYITIRDVHRSTANVYNRTRGDKLLCDISVIQDGNWYRFESQTGGKIPQEKPGFYHCGTVAPIWMNGSHPTTTGVEVTRKACANIPGVKPYGCGRSWTIKVINCGSFYIYQLKRPRQCFLAYCAGKQQLNKRFHMR